MSETEDPHGVLSPAVRRLIKHYDLDVETIRGTGPGGRIRVGDVMALVGARDDTAAEPDADVDVVDAPDARTRPPAPPPAGAPDADEGENAVDALDADDADALQLVGAPNLVAARTGSAHRQRAPATSVFECDMTCVLAHQRRARERGADPGLTAYFVAAFSAALPAWARDAAGDAELGVVLPVPGGTADRAVLIGRAEALALETIAARLAEPASASPDDAAVLIQHHGLSGSIVAYPAPIGADQTLSLGIGKVRRIVAVKNVNGDEAARVTAQCYVSLSFHPDDVGLHTVNDVLGRCVTTLERWPLE